jgi:hypothetical protein
VGLSAAVLALLVALLAVASASAAPNTDLTNPDVRLSDGFYPCPGQTNFSVPPTVEDCLDAGGQRRMPTVVSAYSCAPGGTSTIQVSQRTSGAAFIPGVFQGGWVNGRLTWEITATIGPQVDAAKPTVFPFPGSPPMDSHGLMTGELTSFVGNFTIDPHPFDSSQDISGKVTLAPNAGNWGVCRSLVEQPRVAGGPPLTGDVFELNAGVLTYEVMSGPTELVGETGIAESYFSNTFLTCCDAENPTQVNRATGHFMQQFGTTHPAEGTSGSALTPIGTNVIVSDFQGIDEDVGGVSVTFGSVDTAGETSVTLLTSVPEIPEGFQVGDPPAFYEISTEAEYTGSIIICLGYGSLPAGTVPTLWHYEDGEWVDRTDNVFGPPRNEVCGDVDSLSPFALLFAPGAEAKIGDATSALEALKTSRNGDKLEDVVEKLDKALGKLAQSPPDRQGAAGELEGAVGDIQAAVRSRLLTSTDGNAVMTTIAEAARLLAEEAIAEAQGGDAAKIAEAEAALAAGDARLASGRFKDAIAKYKDAVSKAEGA